MIFNQLSNLSNLGADYTLAKSLKVLLIYFETSVEGTELIMSSVFVLPKQQSVSECVWYIDFCTVNTKKVLNFCFESFSISHKLFNCVYVFVSGTQVDSFDVVKNVLETYEKHVKAPPPHPEQVEAC